MSKNFRYDINGLRAYAVALVVLFHFGVFGFSGGFIGVDIFFVISGFLMTSIISKAIENKNLSILNFYASRAIRIIPALYIVCVTMLIIGWFFLLPLDYKALSKHIFSSINFISNIIYYLESGYFDTSSHNKALLHTWSLSVEWQFYIIFPIIVLILHKINSSKKFLIFGFVTFSILSFILSIYITNKNPSAGFFLLPTRAWEMLAGGLVFFASTKTINIHKNNIALEVIGFFLIGLSIFLFSSNTAWPSYNAIIPILGTALILLANNQKSIFTKSIFFQFLGNTSYSIYLWHWPIVFFLYYTQLLDNIFFVVLGILLSILLGYLSYKFIENPTRKYLSRKSLKYIYIYWILFISILSILTILTHKNNGFQNRFDLEISEVVAISQDINPRREECLTSPGEALKECKYGTGQPTLLVVGDSHADAVMYGIIKALPANSSVISWNISGCTTVEGLKKTNDSAFECGALITETLSKVKQYPSNSPLLIINRTNILFKGSPDREDISKPVRYITTPHNAYDSKYNNEMQTAYVNTLCKFAESREVYVTRPTPEAPFSVPNQYAKNLFFKKTLTEINIPYSEYMERSNLTYAAQNKASQQCGIHIIDLSKAFCDSNECHFIENRKPLFVDDDHISWNASLKLTPYFREIFK